MTFFSLSTRDYQQGDYDLIQDFLDFIQRMYPDAQLGTSRFLLDNYFDKVLDAGGKMLIFEDTEGFCGMLIFRQESAKRARIECVYLIEEYQNNQDVIRQCCDAALDELIEREFKEIVLAKTAYAQPIQIALRQVRFKFFSEDRLWIRRF